MANTIKPASSSPRVEGSTLKWYVGDTFIINWTFEVTSDGEEYTFASDDSITFEFYTYPDRELVTSMSFTGIEDNTVALNFDADVSGLFGIGKYVYCTKFRSPEGDVVTLNANRMIEVQACH